MTEKSLHGKKIAILVESEYVPGEIAVYQKRFRELEATVHFMTRLWGQPTQRFVSDVDQAEKDLQATREKLEIMEVSVDLEAVDLQDYAAVIMAANYTSVRLRYFQPPDGAPIRPEMARTAPAVRFFGRAMRDSRIVKGALCHGLWILTPMPELLAGRRVICHEVVIADVANAGGLYVPPLLENQKPNDLQPAPGVVVDGDLVTGRSWHEVEPFVDAIKDQILRREHEKRHKKPEPADTQHTEPAKKTKPKSILLVISERGYWGEELVGPLEVFDEENYNVDFATPTGKKPGPLPPSMDPEFIDPPLGRPRLMRTWA
jgi:protease I